MVERRLDKEVDEIFSIIKKGHSFLLSGGAGSGKTYSLVETLKCVSDVYPYAQIACITYTNAAAIEIMNRANIENLKVSTIHDFLWNIIVTFQKELRELLIELVNSSEARIKNPDETTVFSISDDVIIQYKEYTRLNYGEVSHDEVIILANEMFKRYSKLCDIIKDKYQFIFVDEYQDTSPLVIEILLDSLNKSKHKNIVGFFGDSMQAIYDDSIGDIEDYVLKGQVYKIEIKQNRRNPYSVIKVANKLRVDGLEQSESQDKNAPNMNDGKIKMGMVKFLYSEKMDVKKVKLSQWCRDWDFADSKNTKELRLTYNLIASEAGFDGLLNIYDKDPLYKFKQDLKKEIKKSGYVVDENESFENVVKNIKWVYKKGDYKGREHLDVLLDSDSNKYLYEHIKDYPYRSVSRMFINKDNLIDDKVEVDGVTVREAKRDCLIQHLFKIQNIMYLYENGMYNDLLIKTQIKINSNQDKIQLKNSIEELLKMKYDTIEAVIDFADQERLCLKDDKLKTFIENNEYLYWRVKSITYAEFLNLYNYLEGYTPFSTQHKIKGLEYKNVLVILDNGGWSNYNFNYLFDKDIVSTLSKSQQNSFSNILLRTKKLFYVCCTRAKDNLIVYYPNPSEGVLSGAEDLFGRNNCINLDIESESSNN